MKCLVDYCKRDRYRGGPVCRRHWIRLPKELQREIKLTADEYHHSIGDHREAAQIHYAMCARQAIDMAGMVQ